MHVRGLSALGWAHEKFGVCLAILFTNLLVLVAIVSTKAKQKEIWPPDYRNTQIHKKVRFLNICRNVNALITSLT